MIRFILFVLLGGGTAHYSNQYIDIHHETRTFCRLERLYNWDKTATYSYKYYELIAKVWKGKGQ